MVGCSLDECSATELPQGDSDGKGLESQIQHNTKQSKGSLKPVFTHVHAYNYFTCIPKISWVKISRIFAAFHESFIS